MLRFGVCCACYALAVLRVLGVRFLVVEDGAACLAGG